MKFFIPSLGTKLRLTQPFTFLLYDERRNDKFWEKFHGNGAGGITTKVYKGPFSRYQPVKALPTTLPVGTVLSVSRIFIRAGSSSFNSITFQVIKIKGIDVPIGRFWIKLDEINENLECEILTESPPFPNGKFILRICEERCRCQNCAGGHNVKHILAWIRNPGNRYSGGFEIIHNLNNDTIQLYKYVGHYNNDNYHYKVYDRVFDSLEGVSDWAKQKNFTLAHVTEFEGAHKEKSQPVVGVENEQ